MELEQIIRLFEERGIKKVKLAGVDIDGVMRGKYISLEKFLSVADSGFGFCDVVFGWDVSDTLYDRGQLTGWHTGFPDALAKIDLSTLRFIPWESDTALFLIDFHHTDGQPMGVSPRQLLQRVIQKASDMGFEPFMACEYEYFLFRENPLSIYEKDYRKLTPLSPGMFGYSILRASEAGDLVHRIVDQMRQYEVELEGIHTETGPGAYETAIRYDTALRAADQAVLFKTGVKEIASRLGLTATFMAKWNSALPGCSGHIHQSLWDKAAKRNLFYNSFNPGKPSKLMKQYIAGQTALMPAMTALSCPTINSYKRIAPGTMAWAPCNASWGLENRTTAIRAILGPSAKSARIEYRLAGADANPYIVMAASLAAGLYGIEHQLDPGEPYNQNAYSASEDIFKPLPLSLAQAVECLAKSDLAKDCLGKEFVEHYIITREWEVREFQKAVTDWELRRYFEII